MSDEQVDELDRQKLESLVDRIGKIQERVIERFPEPDSKSNLTEVDAGLDSFPVTQTIQRLVAVSGDNLHAVALLLSKANLLLPFAPYTLIRASLECAGTAMWLLSGGSSEEFALRALRLEWENKKNRVVAYPEHDGRGESWENRRERLILEAGDSFNLDSTAIKKRILSSDAVSLGSKHFGLHPVMLRAWKGSSGTAHGRTWAVMALSDHKIIPGTESEIGAQYRTYASSSTLVSLLQVAVAAHETLEIGFTSMLKGPKGEFKSETKRVLLGFFTEIDRVGASH